MDHSGFAAALSFGRSHWCGLKDRRQRGMRCRSRRETGPREITNSFFYSANSQTIISIEAPLTFRHVQVAEMEFAPTLVRCGRLTVRFSLTPLTTAGTGCGELTPKHPHTDTLRCGLVHWSGRC